MSLFCRGRQVEWRRRRGWGTSVDKCEENKEARYEGKQHREKKRETQGEEKSQPWTKTSTPTPAALAANSLRERTAAGLLGEMWDGQGECCSANPQGEGGRGFNGTHAIFIHPPLLPSCSSNDITAEHWGTAGLAARMHDHKHSPYYTACIVGCWQVSESKMIEATGLCCHCKSVFLVTACPLVSYDKNTIVCKASRGHSMDIKWSQAIHIQLEKKKAFSNIEDSSPVLQRTGFYQGVMDETGNDARKWGSERDANVDLVFLVTCKLFWLSQPFVFA